MGRLVLVSVSNLTAGLLKAEGFVLNLTVPGWCIDLVSTVPMEFLFAKLKTISPGKKTAFRFDLHISQCKLFPLSPATSTCFIPAVESSTAAFLLQVLRGDFTSQNGQKPNP